MEFSIRLFATLKDKAGKGRISINLDVPTTVDALLDTLAAAHPELEIGLETAIIAVNRNFAEGDTPIEAGDEIAIFPPVSGGNTSFPHPVYFALTTDQPDLNAIHRELIRPDVGAIITFSGSVRGETQRAGLPAETLSLEYEAYEEMAQDRMAQIAYEIWEKWPLVKGVAIVQRIGQLHVGNLTTLVACAAGHRDQGAFAACRYGIDRLKEIVPVWKKEIGRDQSVWVEGEYKPSTQDNLPNNNQ